MKRREFITLVGGSAAMWLSRAQAQQSATPMIGWLSLGSEASVQFAIKAFRSGLADLGYTEGKNIRVLYRFADGNADRLSALMGELVSLGAIIIVTHSTTAIRAAHDAAPNVPIVSWVGPEPVRMGWAQSLARPGGMITGLFSLVYSANGWNYSRRCGHKRPRLAICSMPLILQISSGDQWMMRPGHLA
jgi:putative tryptophan/tyrosine transport system substrate-binding protein